MAEDRLLTYFEFRDYLSHHPETEVIYERGNKTFFVTGDEVDIQQPTPLWLRKLLWFRPVDERSPSRCQW